MAPFMGRANTKYTIMISKKQHKLIDITEILGSMACNLDMRTFRNLALVYSNSFETKVKNEGRDHAIKHFKKLHFVATRIALHDHFSPIQFCKSNKMGTPTALLGLYPYLIGTYGTAGTRLALTVTGLFKAHTGKVDYSTSTISDEGVKINSEILEG